jgi:sensor domain CHASE-containing protein
METFLIILSALLFILVLLMVGILILVLARAKPQGQNNPEVFAAVAQTQTQLENVLQGLAALNGFLTARKEVEENTARAINRLELIIAGTST